MNLRLMSFLTMFSIALGLSLSMDMKYGYGMSSDSEKEENNSDNDQSSSEENKKSKTKKKKTKEEKRKLKKKKEEEEKQIIEENTKEVEEIINEKPEEDTKEKKNIDEKAEKIVNNFLNNKGSLSLKDLTQLHYDLNALKTFPGSLSSDLKNANTELSQITSQMQLDTMDQKEPIAPQLSFKGECLRPLISKWFTSIIDAHKNKPKNNAKIINSLSLFNGGLNKNFKNYMNNEVKNESKASVINLCSMITNYFKDNIYSLVSSSFRDNKGDIDYFVDQRFNKLKVENLKDINNVISNKTSELREISYEAKKIKD